MKKILLLTLIILAFSTASALEPLKVAIFKPGTVSNIQVILRDYSTGTPATIFTGSTVSLSPNSSGIIVINVDNNLPATDWTNISATSINTYYVLDILVNSSLYAQYRLDQLLFNQAQNSAFDNGGNLIPPTVNSALGNDANRWKEAFIAGNTLHIGPALGTANNDELAFSYDDATNTATMTVANKVALTAAEDFITIPQQVTIDGLNIGEGGGNVNTNTTIGLNALSSNITGGNNTATGYQALAANVNSSDNTATGHLALSLNSSGNFNTASGAQALSGNVTGSNNTATGYQALAANVNSSDNTANGHLALSSNSSGNFNTASGAQALLGNVAGSNNTATGYQALAANVNSSDNTATGHLALSLNSSGNFNTASGAQALSGNVTGSNNTATGYQALAANVNSSDNTATGHLALSLNSSGNFNTASGAQALSGNVAGSNNTASGYQALAANVNSSDNTATGHLALSSNSSGNFNTASGAQALLGNVTGSNNTASGYQAGFSIIDGNDNVFLGYLAGNNGVQKNNAQNTIAIGKDTYTTADNQVVIGNTAITETQLNGKLQNDVTTTNHAGLVNANTSIIKYTEITDVVSGDLPATTDGTFLYVLCTVAVNDFLGKAVTADEIVTCVIIDNTWYRVK